MEIKNKYKIEEWDDYYKRERKLHIKPKNGFFSPYDIFLCDSILKKYLPKYNGPQKEAPKIVEIGGGDGKLVKKISDMLGYQPFSIEYSKPAIAEAMSIGVETIEGDVFDGKLLREYKNYFDIVYSYGFVEHILPPEKAIDVHLQLLKPGGYFFVQIPRFRGFNYWKVKILRPDLLPLHNLAIMDKDKLEKICFSKKEIRKIFCENYGTLKLRIPIEKKDIKYYFLKAFFSLERVLSPLLKLACKEKGCETKFFSPAVIFIGKKLQ